MNKSIFDRVIWIVLDGVGAGEAPDADTYQDQGANTLGNLSRAYLKETGSPLSLPHLQKLGIGNITPMEGVLPLSPGKGTGAFGRARELSEGKDTTSGHWEMAGLVVRTPFQTFPHGFPKEVVEKWVQENHLPGVLGNYVASGTEIIQELGEEHIKTGKPILYTSADSVWQVAAHEDFFGLEKLYAICKSARKLCDSLGISRVIARPFVGSPAQGIPFKRTYHRKDYAQLPSQKTVLDHLVSHGIPTLGIGKISSIYCHQGIQDNIDTSGNTDGIRVVLEQMDRMKKGLIFCNLIDFDMLYGHRRNVIGFGKALEEFDQAIPKIQAKMNSRDLLIIAADHGNDPTHSGTDHTREFIPLLVFSSIQNQSGPADLGVRESFGDVGATIFEALLGNSISFPKDLSGSSFLSKLTHP